MIRRFKQLMQQPFSADDTAIFVSALALVVFLLGVYAVLAAALI